MNKVFLSGNTTKDIELRTTPSGKSVCGFTIAITGRKNKEGETPYRFYRLFRFWRNGRIID